MVAGDVAHTRSITSNLITGAIATLLAIAAAVAATSAARGHTEGRRGIRDQDDRRAMPLGRDDR